MFLLVCIVPNYFNQMQRAGGNTGGVVRPNSGNVRGGTHVSVKLIVFIV